MISSWSSVNGLDMDAQPSVWDGCSDDPSYAHCRFPRNVLQSGARFFQDHDSAKQKAEQVYGLLRDYDHHHPNILPDGHLRDLIVEEGGQGEGTLFRLTFNTFGNEQTHRMRVEEPEPGHVLKETDLDNGMTTVFTVEPDDGQSTVTISSTWQPPSGMAGLVDRSMKPLLLRRMYGIELKNLDEYAQSQKEADSGYSPGVDVIRVAYCQRNDEEQT